MSAKHIGFIMDGNGRWAVAHGMSRAEGYAHGLVALYKVAKRCSERGVEAVSVYALSTENFNRPEEELQAIFKVVEKFNLTYDGKYKISYMGDFNSLDDKLASSIEQIEEKTRDNKGMWLNIAFNYGAKPIFCMRQKLHTTTASFWKILLKSISPRRIFRLSTLS